ncbi:hypothetical protein [Actinomadura spongiicola]|uniref:hypothetical protein n=1 Tax=Actinomadura spongiicola TaxID=2303421 RepID=UPI0018F14F4F|nr:hypothetical protein [Actinomadura spongiicola]
MFVDAGFGAAAASNPAPQPRSPVQSGPSRPERAQEPPPPPPDEPPPPPEPVDESDEVDPEGDADADGAEAETSGMALLQRELGGQIIREFDTSTTQP